MQTKGIIDHLSEGRLLLTVLASESFGGHMVGQQIFFTISDLPEEVLKALKPGQVVSITHGMAFGMSLPPVTHAHAITQLEEGYSTTPHIVHYQSKETGQPLLRQAIVQGESFEEQLATLASLQWHTQEMNLEQPPFLKLVVHAESHPLHQHAFYFYSTEENLLVVDATTEQWATLVDPSPFQSH